MNTQAIDQETDAPRPPSGMALGRTLGFTGLGGLAIVVAAFLLLGNDLLDRTRRDAVRTLEATSYLLADHASRLFEVSDVALRGATADMLGQDWDAVAQSEPIFRQLRALRSALPYVEDVWLNDETGLLRLTSFAFPAPFSNAADRDIFKAQREPTDKLYVSERIVGRVTQRPTFLLAKRLTNPDGSFHGMVSVTADLGYFDDYWSRIDLPYDARVTLFRRESLDVLAQHPAPAAGQVFVPPQAAAVRSALADDPSAGVIDYVGTRDGEQRIAAYRRVGDLPLYVSVSVSSGAVNVAWRRTMTMYGLFAAGGCAALIALTLFGFRQTRREAVVAGDLRRARLSLAAVNVGLERTVVERTLELRASEARHRLILESAIDYAIVATDLAGHITHWNVGAQNLLGWDSQEAIGLSLSMIFTPEDQATGRVEGEFGTALTAGRAADDRWHVRKDGSRFFAMGAMLPMRLGEDGTPVGFLKILRDRTREFEIEDAKRTMNETLERLVAERTDELRAANERLVLEATSRELAEEKLRQSQKMEAVGRLTGGVAHDFNNLLTIVMGNLDMLRRRVDGNPDLKLQKLIGQATEGANRAAALTYRLLAFARQQPLAPEPIDANKLVAGVSDLLRRTLGENIAVETVLAGGLWRTHADPNQLESALLNLAVNARDAMPDGGKLTIETGNTHLDEAYAATREDVKPGQYVMIAVCDTGQGMTPDVMAKVFEPFFTTKALGKGTGLGLSQVYGFVKQSNGHAAIYSEVGHGTTLKLYLPRFMQAMDRTAPSPAADARTVERRPSRGRGQTILVVEDEALVREFSIAALEDAGYRVLAAEDGPAALALLDAHPEIAVLFTDVVLTGPMNGRKIADEALRRRPDLKVLFTTGYTRNAIIHHGRLDEGVNLIGKPFTASGLAQKLAGLLAASSPGASGPA